MLLMCSQTGAQIRTITILEKKPYKSSRVYTLLNHSHWFLHVKGKRCEILNLHKLFFIYFSFFALLALYIFFPPVRNFLHKDFHDMFVCHPPSFRHKFNDRTFLTCLFHIFLCRNLRVLALKRWEKLSGNRS